MSEKAEATTKETNTVTEDKPVRSAAKPNNRRQHRNTGRKNDRKPRQKRKDDVDKKIVSIRRVSHTYKGGKRMSLSVLVVVGDKNGKVGAGLGKGADVKSAEAKALSKAKKSMVKVNLSGNTIPHQISFKKGAAKLFMKPAKEGTGVIAGGSMRAVLELVGVKDILTKVIGTSNSISNVYATIEALQNLKNN